MHGEELEGLSIAHWSRVLRELRQRHTAEAELTLRQRNKAIQKIRIIIDEAKDSGGLIDPEYTSDRLQYLEKNLAGGLMFNHPETPPAGMDDAPFGQKIDPLRPTEPRDQPNAVEYDYANVFGYEDDWKLED